VAFFKSKEEKQAEKEEKNQQQWQIEENTIAQTKGKYYVHLFSDFSSGKYGVHEMYQKVAGLANRHDLNIIQISKPEDGFMRDGVSAIFEKTRAHEYKEA